jgi:predicted nucleic acid-binding protein
MALIVDASVAIKWFIDEPGSEAARRLWRDEPELLAPDLVVAEVCNAAWRKVRLGQCDPAQAKEIAARLRHGMLALRPTVPLASRAIELALDLDHPVYECFYLALAEGEKARLVTADRRLKGPSPLHLMESLDPKPVSLGQRCGDASDCVQAFASGRIWPPSTTIVVPVMYAASSEARNSMACATSCGVPSRPSGTERSIA